MKRVSNILWGLVLVAVGVVLALKAFDVFDFEIFFDGWWTLFIIVPCFISLITDRDKTGSIIGLAVGVVLLLAAQGVFRFDMVWKLILPFIAVVIGLRLIFKDVFNKKSREVMNKIKEKGVPMKQYCATFSGQNADFSNEEFDGAELTAVFGGVKCDLRQAIMKEDCVINICSVFGGVTVYVPENVNVKISSTSIFGGISDDRKVRTNGNPVTLYINGNCIFGGAEIK